MVNSVNCPGSVSTSILPPCCFTMMSWLIELGCKERVEHLFLYFTRDSGAVVADADFHAVAKIFGRGTERRLEIWVTILRLALSRGIESVREQVEEGAGDFLRKQLYSPSAGVEVTLKRD